MRSKTAKLLIDHALTLATGVLLGVSLTVPVMSTDFVSAVSAVGSLLAGAGTVGLLLFGWLKADSWIAQNKSNARISLIIESSKDLIGAAETFSHFVKTDQILNADPASRTLLQQELGVNLIAEFYRHTNAISLILETLKNATQPAPKSNLDKRFRSLNRQLRQLTPIPASILVRRLSIDYRNDLTFFMIDLRALRLELINHELL